jgi:hypothetical protein
MPDWFLLILAILVCYRLAMLIAKDEIFKPLRQLFSLSRFRFVRHHLAYLVHCPYCAGVWVAAALALLLWPVTWFSPVYWLAIAGGQAFLQKVSDLSEAVEE